MYRLNLKHQRTFRGLYPAVLRFLAVLLAGMFLVQIVFIAHDRRRAALIRAEAENLDATVAALEFRRSALAETVGNPATVAGALKARNEWLASRARNPLAVLSRLETNKPANAELKSFISMGTGGSLKMASPDTETAARWLNAAFGNARGRMTVEERVMGRLSILFAWND